MLRKPGIYILTLALLLVIISIRIDSPPGVIDATAPDSVFSAKRAYGFLQEICKAPHSTGTVENKRVREYIANQCKNWGLQTSIQQTTAIIKGGSRITSSNVYTAANVYNVIARLKGTDPQKSLLVMAHYDSQPNTPGAGDDGAGVAAMLETARILTTSGKKFRNDIVFLFTDAEESGLLGARGFVQDSVLKNEVGLVLDFEGRGNAGVSSMFEVNAKNGWAVTHYIEAAEFPAGSSLGYEIYKTLPNDTDYTVFREAGISGLNTAFSEGFVNYHSPNDKPENLDLRSLQQHGSNMLSLVKHFGNISLVETKADDISFFNVLGNTMIHYPASWNRALTILCSLSAFLFIYIGFRKNKITIKGAIAGFFSFIGLLVLLFFATMFLIKGIEYVYPLYKHFYASNSYNCYYYFTAFTAMAVVFYAILFRWLLRKFTMISLLAGTLLFETAILILIYVWMPTAIFIMLFPLIFTLAGNILLLVRDDIKENVSNVLQLVFLLPAILLLAPALKILYTVFGLSIVAGSAVVVLGLLLGFLLPLFSEPLKETRLVAGGAGLIFIIALLLAHINSTYTAKEPLQTYAQYQLRADEHKAYWISSYPVADDWNRQFFPNAKLENGRLQNDAPLISLTEPEATIQKDTVIEGVRRLYLHCRSTREAITMRLEFDEKNKPTRVEINGPAGGNGNKETAKGSYGFANYIGLESAGFDMMLEVQPNIPFKITLTDRSMGLPVVQGIHDYSPEVIPGQGWNANTTQVVKRFEL